MSSGSYFTIYRKKSNCRASQEVLAALKNEYFLSNKSSCLCKDSTDEDEMKKDIPLFMDSEFKSKPSYDEDSKKTSIYYDKDGIVHEKLLDFHFGSAFTCLREHFALNPYKLSQSSVVVSKADAEKMLQAIEYVLSEEYSKKFESVLNNEYVKMFGDGYTPFDNRFKTAHRPIYVDKDGDDGYTVSFNDQLLDDESTEFDDGIKFHLCIARACLLAYLNAEVYSYRGEELVLEYSAY